MVHNKERLFYDASGEIHRRARELRQRMRESEIILWPYLRNRNLIGYKFRRQHPISYFIVDFYCHELQLVIELDGKIHFRKEVREYDEARTKELNKKGIRVIRFTNEEVFRDLNGVLSRIGEVCGEIKNGG